MNNEVWCPLPRRTEQILGHRRRVDLTEYSGKHIRRNVFPLEAGSLRIAASVLGHARPCQADRNGWDAALLDAPTRFATRGPQNRMAGRLTGLGEGQHGLHMTQTRNGHEEHAHASQRQRCSR